MADDKQLGYGGKFTVEWRGDIAVLTIDCGQNRCNNYFVENYVKSLDEVLKNPKAKALITTGKGKFYSNGLDLDWMSAVEKEDPQNLIRFAAKLSELDRRLLLFPLPTVAAINGHAFAAGAILTLCHDYRVMNASRGWWCLNEVHIGRTFRNVSRQIVHSRIPSGPVFNDAVVLGTRYTAEQALKVNLVTQTTPTEDTLISDCLQLLKERLPAQGYNRDFLQAAKEDAYPEIVDAKL